MSEKRITAEMLAQKDAHCAQLDKFRERWPDGLDPAAVTPEEVADLSVGWAVHALLPATAWEAFKEAITPEREAEARAWDAFVEARATSWEKHMGAEATAPEAYREDRATAWEAYREAIARAAIAVFREYWQEEEGRAGP